MDKKIQSGSIINASNDQVSSDFTNGEVVILNISEGIYYSLEEVGAHIWKMILEPTAYAEIREGLLDEYDVDPYRCDEEVKALLLDLHGNGLIEINNDETA